MRALPILVLLLAACGAAEGERQGLTIDCALGLRLEMAPECVVQQEKTGIVVIRHPDGGFRRFLRQGDTLVLADGAERLEAASGPAFLRLAVGEDVYLVPRAWLDEPTHD